VDSLLWRAKSHYWRSNKKWDNIW